MIRRRGHFVLGLLLASSAYSPTAAAQVGGQIACEGCCRGSAQAMAARVLQAAGWGAADKGHRLTLAGLYVLDVIRPQRDTGGPTGTSGFAGADSVRVNVTGSGGPTYVFDANGALTLEAAARRKPNGFPVWVWVLVPMGLLGLGLAWWSRRRQRA